MEKQQIKAIQKQIQEWKRYQEPPGKIARMAADAAVKWITEYRQKNATYLQKQLDAVKLLQETLAAKSSYIDPDVVAKNSLKFAALPTARLKVEIPKSYTDALVLAKELRARGADKEADHAAMRADVFSQDYLFDRDFQTILSDTMTREAFLAAPNMIPTCPLENITRANQNIIGVVPLDDFIKQIANGDAHLHKAITALVDADAGRGHLPQSLRDGYYELSKLRVHLEPNLDDFTAGWDPERKEEFMKNLPETVLEKFKAPEQPAADPEGSGSA